MTHDGGIHVDHAMPFLDQPVVESLMIPLDVVMLGVFPHSMAEMLLSQWDDLGQALGLDGTNKSLRVGIQIWTSRGKLHRFDA